MVGAAVYDWMYRLWAPWDSVGVRKDLIALLEQGSVAATTHPRAIDLGCGTGANVVHLAGLGFDAWGIDFSEVAIEKARRRAEHAGVDAHFVVGDLTAETVPGVSGSFDLLLDFGTLDDLRGESRRAMARTATKLAAPHGKLLLFCFYGVTEELPLISFSGTSRMSHIAPGEMEDLFGDAWEIATFAADDQRRIRTFLLSLRSSTHD